MTQVESRVHVFVAQGEVLPGAFRWNARTLRVLSVELAGIRGNERRYRLSTCEGVYELGVEVGTGAWHVRHSPGRVSRFWAAVQRAPRYALPGGRRRPVRPAPRQLVAEAVPTGTAPLMNIN